MAWVVSTFSGSFIFACGALVSFRDERRWFGCRLGFPPAVDELTSLTSEAGSPTMPFGSLVAGGPVLLLFASVFFLLLRPKGQMAISSSPTSVSNVSPPLARLPPRRQHVKIDSLEKGGAYMATEVASIRCAPPAQGRSEMWMTYRLKKALMMRLLGAV